MNGQIPWWEQHGFDGRWREQHGFWSLDQEGQTISHDGRRLVEPQDTAVKRASSGAFPPPSVLSMVSTASGDMPPQMSTASSHNDHKVADTLVGIAAVAGATYVVKKASDAYIGNSRERYLRWMRVW